MTAQGDAKRLEEISDRVRPYAELNCMDEHGAQAVNDVLFLLKEIERLRIFETKLAIAEEALLYIARGPRLDDSDMTVAKQALEKIRGEEK